MSDPNYVGLNEAVEQGKITRRRRCFWVTGGVVLLCIILIVIFAVIGATSNDNKSKKSSSSSSSYVNTDGLIVTGLGRMQGNILTGSSPDDSSSWIYEFLGVRFAHSINASTRFTPARIYNTCSSDANETYDATAFGAACPQEMDASDEALYGTAAEDCLFLNIWTPYIPASSAVDADASQNSSDASEDDSELLPVMLFIHGGSFVAGSGAAYNGTKLVQKGGNKVVYVSINYRLGLLGFLQMKELYDEGTSGAYGYQWPSYGGLNGINDQIVALKWVRQMIGAFGGDKDRITVFGESAGALSVCMQLISDLVRPNGESLMYQAIVESGPCTGPWGPKGFQSGLDLNEQVLRYGSTYGDLFNLSKLRDLTVDQIINDVQGGSIASGGWALSIDMIVLTANTSTLYTDASNVNAQRIIWGFNSQDGLAGWPFYSGVSPDTETELESMLMGFINDSSVVSDLLNTYYPLSDFYNNASIAWYGLNSDVCIQCPTFEVASGLQSTYANESEFEQFMYDFRGYYSPYLAPHASELVFVFDAGAAAAAHYKMRFNETLAKSMISAWNEFAVLEEDDSDLFFKMDSYEGYTNVQFKWLSYGYGYENNRTVIVFDDDIVNYKNYDQEYRNGACKYWKQQVEVSVRAAICQSAF